MIRDLIFDLDGTLVDSCGPCVEILNAMLADRQSDYRIATAAARPHMSLGGGHLVESLLGAECVDPVADLADFRARYQARLSPPDDLFPGVAEGLAALHEMGFRLAICSNKPQHLCQKVLQDTGLAPYFDLIVGGQDGLMPKPAPDMLNAVVDRLGCSPDACLYIGDSELDHEVAQRAGMAFSFVTYGYATPGWTPTVGDRHDNFGDLVDAIRARTGAAHA